MIHQNGAIEYDGTDTQYPSRTPDLFSLTSDDFEKLRDGGERGEIYINGNTISKEMQPLEIPDDFWTGLQSARQIMSRVKDMGVRHLICHFLIHATLISRRMFNEERLIVHSEYEVAETEISPIGKLQEPLESQWLWWQNQYSSASGPSDRTPILAVPVKHGCLLKSRHSKPKGLQLPKPV